MSNALQTVTEQDSSVIIDIQQSPVDFKNGVQLLPVKLQNEALAQYTERRTNFRTWLLAQLRQGVHYGFPPGCEAKLDKDGNVVAYAKGGYQILNPKQWTVKPSLYKAGALFVIELMKVEAIYQSDLDAWRMMGEPKGTLVRTCRLRVPGAQNFLGEGTGAYDVGKKGMDTNAAIKMADKNAATAAVINVFALSDLFTQDMEGKTVVQGKVDLTTDFSTLVQKWVDAALGKKHPLHGHKVSDLEMKALKSNIQIWCKGNIPTTAQMAIDWLKKNCEIKTMEDQQGAPIGIKFAKKA